MKRHVLAFVLVNHSAYGIIIILYTFSGRYARDLYAFDDNVGEGSDHVCMDSLSNDCMSSKNIPLGRMSCIDSDYTDDTVNPKVSRLRYIFPPPFSF
jgi:hypothetical protein